MQFIQDYPALPRLMAFDPPPASRPARMAGVPRGPARVGVIGNRRSHRNRGGRAPEVAGGDVIAAVPETRAALTQALAEFRARGVDLLVVDGGDGTVRDVLTCGGVVWDGDWPTLAVVPAGKTNALAIDLGVPEGWTVEAAVAAAARGGTVVRSPLEIVRADGDSVPLRGFLLGAGAFVGATELAQHTHRAGAFRGVAVGLALGWALAQTLLGSDRGAWRAGTAMHLTYERSARARDGGVVPDGEAARYLLLASALTRLPVGLKPFGPPRDGMKTLVVEAPPRRLAAAVPAILRGTAAAWLAEAGYHRVDARSVEVELDGNFILDGEIFPGGRFLLREGPSLTFAVP